MYLSQIEWSRAAFYPLSGFTFKHLDIYSSLYNQDGMLDVEQTSLPELDNTADLIICGSLFTHLVDGAFKHYLREVARCLSPQGRAIISTHNVPVEGTRFSGKETRIDIADEYMMELSQTAGLRLVEKIGSVFGQEVFVFERV